MPRPIDSAELFRSTLCNRTRDVRSCGQQLRTAFIAVMYARGEAALCKNAVLLEVGRRQRIRYCAALCRYCSTAISDKLRLMNVVVVVVVVVMQPLQFAVC